MRRIGRYILFAIVGLCLLAGIGAALTRGDQETGQTTPQRATTAALEPVATQTTVAAAEVIAPAPVGADVTATAPVLAAEPAPAPAAAPPASTVTLGEPVNLSAWGANMVAVPVTNSGDTVKSFTVKATYKNGDQIAATASGAGDDRGCRAAAPRRDGCGVTCEQGHAR